MKLNYKRTILVGFAFFLICMFWQAYDNTIPMILTNKFGMSQTWSGLIMALDNVLALFLLPLFGAISDRCKSPRGRRTPFILFGTIIAVIAFIGLSVVDSVQLSNISNVSSIDDTSSLTEIYEQEKDTLLITPDGDSFTLSEVYTENEFSAIQSVISDEDGKDITNPEYTNFVVPARQSYIKSVTHSAPYTLIIFILLLLVSLVSMSTFRSPAVALMPDVTIKPLRSKANAIINLMGTAGGIIVLVLGFIFGTSRLQNSMMEYTFFFGAVAAFMLIALIIFMFTVKEPLFVREMHEESAKYHIDESANTKDTGKNDLSNSKLTPAQKKSLIFILLSIVFWFMGYNAVTSKYSVYATTILQKDYNLTLMIAQVAAIISYLPVGIIASKIGRKKTIMSGVIMLSVAFGGAMMMSANSPTLLMNIFFALAGIAWATINVNSFPMVVEMCSGNDVGKYTGYYYTASMAAQVATPILSGLLMDKLGMRTLFPYATIFVAIAFITMAFVMHGDSKPLAKAGLDALEDAE